MGVFERGNVRWYEFTYFPGRTVWESAYSTRKNLA